MFDGRSSTFSSSSFRPRTVGGAAFTPAKSTASSFFGSLLKPDAAATPAMSTPVSTGVSHDTPVKSKRPAPAPSHEDLQLLMDQISQLSQAFADSQMANTELTQASIKTQQLYDQMKVERDFMIAKTEVQEKEMAKLKEKISFSALDATNEQLKQLKSEAQEMAKENEALKQQNHILYQNYADIKSVDGMATDPSGDGCCRS